MDGNNIDNKLIPTGKVKWNETDVPIHERGIRGGWIFSTLLEIQELRNQISEQHESHSWAALWRDVPEPDYHALDGKFTAKTLMKEHIIPWTQELSAPLYARIWKMVLPKPE